MDTKMRLSIAGGSGWAAETVRHCPHQHYLKYEQGWRIKKMPKPLGFGILMHEAVFTNDFESFSEAWRRGTILKEEGSEWGKDWEIDRNDVEIDKDIELGEKMFKAVESENLQFKDVEKKLVTPIVNPETGKTPSHLEGVEVSGWRDMIEDYEGSEDMSDLKTSAAKWPEGRANVMIQLPTYRYLEACTGEKIHNKGHYLIITKTKVPKFQRQTVKMGDNDFFSVYTKFKAAAEDILKYRKEAEGMANPAKAWPKTGPCQGMYGQPCQYHPICFPERYDNPEDLVNEKLEARF